MYRVIVADDEYLEREVIKKIVRDIDGVAIVGEANNGVLTVELCSVLKPDIVFLNCGMGGMGGIEAAWKIRQIDKDVVIILTSADESNFHRFAEAEFLASLNIAERLLKPIPPATIREVVFKYNRKDKKGVNISPKMKKRLKFYPPDMMSKEITKALAYIDAHYWKGVDMKSVAEEVSLSCYYFSRLFKKEVGVNFSQYILHKRLELAKQMLEETDRFITDIAVTVGFQEHSYFGKIFKQLTGDTPSEYRKKLAQFKEERKKIKDRYL
ncbi:MAG: helix-turn-helix domain-containing protein [Synergistaceae bacterium]|jgi:YesN/AraC family two-component response regulator|nr:helix-turn-helix domain-containing protein [Synergistaceae bacterium]